MDKPELPIRAAKRTPRSQLYVGYGAGSGPTARSREGPECANSGRSGARWQWRNSTRGRFTGERCEECLRRRIRVIRTLRAERRHGARADRSGWKLRTRVFDRRRLRQNVRSARIDPSPTASLRQAVQLLYLGGRPSTGRQRGAARCGLTHLSRAGAASPPIEVRCRRQSFPNPKIS